MTTLPIRGKCFLQVQGFSRTITFTVSVFFPLFILTYAVPLVLAVSFPVFETETTFLLPDVKRTPSLEVIG